MYLHFILRRMQRIGLGYVGIYILLILLLEQDKLALARDERMLAISGA